MVFPWRVEQAWKDCQVCGQSTDHGEVGRSLLARGDLAALDREARLAGQPALQRAWAVSLVHVTVGRRDLLVVVAGQGADGEIAAGRSTRAASRRTETGSLV